MAPLVPAGRTARSVLDALMVHWEPASWMARSELGAPKVRWEQVDQTDHLVRAGRTADPVAFLELQGPSCLAVHLLDPRIHTIRSRFPPRAMA